MISRAEIFSSLVGVWRLLRQDVMALAYFNRTVEGFWNSFFAAVLAAPAYTVIVLLHETGPRASSQARSFAIEVLAYLIGWLAYPVIAHFVLQALGRSARFVDFIIVYNWWAVLQVSAYLPISILYSLDRGRTGAATLFGFSATLAILYSQWFVMRAALQSTAGPAVLMVLLDIVTTQSVDKLADWVASSTPPAAAL